MLWLYTSWSSYSENVYGFSIDAVTVMIWYIIDAVIRI